jgi:SAM-dependent methyltransferase
MPQSFHDHFSGVASRYADFRPHYPAALFDYLASLAPISSVVWDCGTGNGQAAVDLADRFEKVVATDASREQIASASPHPKVEYRVAPAEQSGLPDASVSLIAVAQALHWFNLNRFYEEANRVLKPGGVLAVWGYGFNQVEGEAANDIVQHFYSMTVGPYWPPERKLIEQGYRPISFPFVETVPPAFGMEANWTLDELIGYFSTWSATTRFVKARGFSPLGTLAAELAAVWGETNAPRRITWTLPMRVGRKTPTPPG